MVELNGFGSSSAISTFADYTTATRIEMQLIKEDKRILDVPFK